VKIKLDAKDPDDGKLRFVIVSKPSHGRIVQFSSSTGTLAYVPDENYDGKELLDLLGNAQMESEIEKRVTKVLRDQQQTLSEQSGISISALGDDYDLKLYVNEVLEEVKRNKK
jgi:hypothetical protein